MDNKLESILSITLLKNLQKIRKDKKLKERRNYRLSSDERTAILAKTNNKCHVCGIQLDPLKFHADHVVPHSSSSNSRIDNFLPSCTTCNNYRWFYEPEEIQWILKLGVFMKSEIINSTKLGKETLDKFLIHETKREIRRAKKTNKRET